MKGHAFNYVVISRRQCFRAGTRYYMRGVDSEGYAANFVETEQIVEYDNSRCSFVQVCNLGENTIHVLENKILKLDHL